MADGSTAKALQTKYTNPYTEELKLFEKYVRTTLQGSQNDGKILLTKQAKRPPERMEHLRYIMFYN